MIVFSFYPFYVRWCAFSRLIFLPERSASGGSGIWLADTVRWFPRDDSVFQRVEVFCSAGTGPSLV